MRRTAKQSNTPRQLPGIHLPCSQVWLKQDSMLNDLLNSDQTSVQPEKYSHLQIQCRQQTNSKISQAAETTLHILLTQKIKFSAINLTRMAIFRAGTFPLLCLMLLRPYTAETAALDTNGGKKVQTHRCQLELAVPMHWSECIPQGRACLPPRCLEVKLQL